MKVGDYVRTDKGYIFQVVNINDFREPSMKYGVEASYVKDVGFLGDEDIIKSSSNIIDLIEVGDYINGHKVVDIAEAPKRAVYIEDINQQCGLIPYTRDNITSVLTKEQFERMEYKI